MSQTHFSYADLQVIRKALDREAQLLRTLQPPPGFARPDEEIVQRLDDVERISRQVQNELELAKVN